MALWRSLFAEEVELPRGTTRPTQTSTAGRNHLPQMENAKADIRDRRAQSRAMDGGSDSGLSPNQRLGQHHSPRDTQTSGNGNGRDPRVHDLDDMGMEGHSCFQHSTSSAPVFQSIFSEASTPTPRVTAATAAAHADGPPPDRHSHSAVGSSSLKRKEEGDEGGKMTRAISGDPPREKAVLSSTFRVVGQPAPSASSFTSRRSAPDTVQEEILEEVDCQMAHNVFVDNFGFYVSLEEKAAESAYLRLRRVVREMGKWNRSVLPKWGQLKPDEKKRWCRAGVPAPLRKKVWLLLLNVLPTSSLHKPATAKQASAAKAAYERLCQTPLSDVDEKAYGGIIERDLPRTFSTNMLFDRDSAAACGQDQLRRVLRAYAQRNRDVGYCQGMATLAATLLLVMENEWDTYLCFCALMEDERYGLQSYYKPGFPELHRSLYVLDGLAKKTLPKIWRLMQKSGIPYAVFATSWLLTLFSHSFNFRLVCRLWDMFLCEGWKPVFRLVLGLLKLDQDRLVAVKDDAMLMQLLQQATERKDPVKILQVSQGIDFTTKQMNDLRRAYDNENKAASLGGGGRG